MNDRAWASFRFFLCCRTRGPARLLNWSRVRVPYLVVLFFVAFDVFLHRCAFVRRVHGCLLSFSGSVHYIA